MKSKFLQVRKMLLVAAGLLVGASAWADTGTAKVKMTYVNYDEPDKSYGEIAAGSTAKTGYNKISNGEVAFENVSWSENCITYLQVDVSDLPENAIVTNATLTFEGSGSGDSKRTQHYVVGYNDSEWSSEMTYGTADKSITQMGTLVSSTSTKATTFDNITFNIIDALKNSENKLVTILVCAVKKDNTDNGAGGAYIKNPTVSVTYTTEQAYNVTFTETNGVEAVIMVNGSDVTKGTSLPNGDYNFTAIAEGYKDYAGSFKVEDSELNVEFTMIAKETYNYTVKGTDGNGTDFGVVNSGSGYEGTTVTYYYPEFVLSGTTLYKKNNNNGNPYWGATGTLDTDNKEFTVTYNSGTISNVVFYKEAEEMDGFTAKTTNNAPIRCSNGIGGIVSSEVLLTKLPAGKYTIFGQVWGTEGLTAGVKANGVDVWTLASTGSLVNNTSAEFNLVEETELYVYTTGGNDNHMLDLIYIVKTGEATTSVSAEITTAGWATLYTPYALDFSTAGLTAYTATCDGSTVTLTEVENVPANTGVVLKGEANTYSIPVIASSETAQGDLKGSVTEALTYSEDAEKDYYMLALNEDNEVQFTKLISGSIAAGKAYLEVEKATGARVLSIVFAGETTGIAEVEKAGAENGAIYNLSGQRVSKPASGLYIVNGKKVVIK